MTSVLRLLIDESFNHNILRGLKLRLHSLDLIVAQDTALKGASDRQLLAWAADHNRILVTHEVKTVPKYAYERIAAGQPVPGVIVIPETLPVAAAINDLATIIACSHQDEWRNQVLYLPL